MVDVCVPVVVVDVIVRDMYCLLSDCDCGRGWVVEGPRQRDIEQNFMEGFLSAKNLRRGFFTQEWSRYYFVLQKSDMYYYHSREDYLLHPKRSITNRPISVAG